MWINDLKNLTFTSNFFLPKLPQVNVTRYHPPLSGTQCSILMLVLWKASLRRLTGWFSPRHLTSPCWQTVLADTAHTLSYPDRFFVNSYFLITAAVLTFPPENCHWFKYTQRITLNSQIQFPPAAQTQRVDVNALFSWKSADFKCFALFCLCVSKVMTFWKSRQFWFKHELWH